MDCLWCGERVRVPLVLTNFFSVADPPLCSRCSTGLERISADKLCRICGREMADGDLCTDCVRWEASEAAGLLCRSRSLFHYNDFMKEYLARYKFRGDAVLIEAFSEDLKRLYKKEYSGTVLVPIPVSKARGLERGFNQSLLIAELCGGPVMEGLAKTHDESKQSKKSRAERMKVGRNPFEVRPACGLAGKRVTLVDDIYTTGMTLRLAARVLRDSGALDIQALTLVRG